MNKLYDLASIRLTLMKAVQNGHFTVEQLDTPSPGFVTCTAVDREHFPGGYEGVQFRNLLREDPAPTPTVQAAPDPKDFAEVLPKSNTPAQAPELPLTLEQSHDECPF